MLVCIFCLTELGPTNPPSTEHVFPQAIGGTLTITHVCRACNNRLGSDVDSGLANNWLIQNVRLLRRLPGKDGRLPNPFQLVDTRDEFGGRVEFRLTKDGKPDRLRALYNETEITDAAGLLIGYKVRIDESDAAAIPKIRAAITKRLDAAPGQLATAETHTANDAPKLTMKVKVNERDFLPCLLKIAYEIAYIELGPTYLTDPTAAAFRALLARTTMTDADAADIGASYGLGTADRLQPVLPTDPTQLVAALMRAGDCITAHIRIFEVAHAFVAVSRSASAYTIPFGFDGPAYTIAPPTRRHTKTTIDSLVGLALSAQSDRVSALDPIGPSND